MALVTASPLPELGVPTPMHRTQLCVDPEPVDSIREGTSTRRRNHCFA